MESLRPVRPDHRQGLILKTAVVWLCIFLLAGFIIASKSTSSPITMSVIPEVPKTGEPIVVTFNLNNPTDQPLSRSYQLYANDRFVQSGNVTVSPKASAKYQYAYRNPLAKGEQVNFALKTSSDSGDIDKTVSLPAYPPQLLSSFVSFAAFSTSVMSSMITTEYFNNVFGTTNTLNTGIIVAVVLIALLIFLELTQTGIAAKKGRTLASYRTAFGTISAVLFAIFVGMVFTKVVMILAT